MDNIPTDNTLKRHYLTELKFKQTSNFENFMKATEQQPQEIETVPYYPFWSNQVLIPLIGFIFMMCVVFL